MNTKNWIDFIVKETESALTLLYFYNAFYDALNDKELLNSVNDNSLPSYEQICHNDKTGTKYGEIVCHDYDSENKIQRLVHGTLLVSKERFNHIFDLLLSRERIDNNSSVLIMLKIFGLELGFEIDVDKWPVDKVIAITDFKLTLLKASNIEKT